MLAHGSARVAGTAAGDIRQVHEWRAVVIVQLNPLVYIDEMPIEAAERVALTRAGHRYLLVVAEIPEAPAYVVVLGAERTLHVFSTGKQARNVLPEIRLAVQAYLAEITK